MIEFLHGELIARAPARAVVRVGGVGFDLQIPLSTYEALPREGAEVHLLTHLQVRDDALALYGFATPVERSLFRMLLGVSRVGPAVALHVLSSCRPGEFKRMIMDEDVDALAAMTKGIGAKTARRLVAELQGPIETLEADAGESLADRVARDAVDALVALGEPRATAQKAVQAALARLGPGTDSQRLVEEALSH